MKLTPFQRRNLACYLHFRECSPTVWSLIWFSRKVFLALILYLGTLIGLVFFAAGIEAGVFFGIVALAFLLQHFSYLRQTARFFPVLREVTDFDKVSEMLKADDNSQKG